MLIGQFGMSRDKKMLSEDFGGNFEITRKKKVHIVQFPGGKVHLTLIDG